MKAKKTGGVLTAVGSLEVAVHLRGIFGPDRDLAVPYHSSYSLFVKMADDDAGRYRLPTNVRPRHYDLTIRTDLEALKYDGYVTVQ